MTAIQVLDRLQAGVVQELPIRTLKDATRPDVVKVVFRQDVLDLIEALRKTARQDAVIDMIRNE